MASEQYIEHEVKLRVHDERFKIIEHKLNFVIGAAITGLLIPIVLKFI